MSSARARAAAGARAGLISLSLALLGCGGATSALIAPERGDEPMPAAEKRDELRLVLSLPRSSGCEETFDLRLYEDRAVELVEWDAADGCDARSVKIRYLPGRRSRDALLSRVRELAAPDGVREQK